MFKTLSLVIALWSILIAPAATAQGEGGDAKPTIAFVNTEILRTYQVAEAAIIQTLAANGFLTKEEGAALFGVYLAGQLTGSPSEPEDLAGERVNLFWENAGGDLSSLNLVLDTVLDREPDILITVTDRVTQVALNATLNMDDPPAIIFVMAYNPYLAGIAQTRCIKPEHVIGVESIAPYDEIMRLLRLQKPDLQVIGTIYSLPDASSLYGAERITALAEEMGISVKQAGVTQIADLRAATTSLLEADIEMLVLPIDVVTGPGLPIIMSAAVEHDVPVLYSHIAGAGYATIGAGSAKMFEEGYYAGQLLAAHLKGEIDIAGTSIVSHASMGIGLNMDVASMQGIEFAEELVAMADVIIENGRASFASEDTRLGLYQPDPGTAPLDLDSVRCTPEMIAEQ